MNASVALERPFRRMSTATFDEAATKLRRGPRVVNIPAPRSLNELRRFEDYLARLHVAPVELPAPHAATVRMLWAVLRAKVPGLPLPAAGPSNDGFQLAWSTPRWLIEIDVLPDGTFHWFGSDRTTGEHQGSEQPASALPEAAFGWLAHLARR